MVPILKHVNNAVLTPLSTERGVLIKRELNQFRTKINLEHRVSGKPNKQKMSTSKVKSTGSLHAGSDQPKECNSVYFINRPYWSKIKFNAITGIIRRRNTKW
jgi:hypothetical protein